ncbi:MAG: tyrosine-type recombinase/integrase [Defluviitaleaceae bacterium]|nr:tyrosine-type recombinase/integrase [Defluviitaleaceae bacterium]
MKTTEPIRNKKQIRKLVEYYLKQGQIRNYVIIVMALYTALRISDILSIGWNDVYDFTNGRVRQTLTLTEKKTGKIKTIALHESIILSYIKR